MFTRKDRTIKNQKTMIKNRDILIADLERKIEAQKKENMALYEENKDLRRENEELVELVKRINKLANANKYNNEKAFTSKIKELVRDYQSKN